jgi:small subunit ribosomal protein S6
MKEYEIVYILLPHLENTERQSIVDGIHSIFKKPASEIVSIDDWGNRELAYPIKKNKRGYYIVLHVKTSDSHIIDEFSRLMNINEKVIRYLVVKQ